MEDGGEMSEQTGQIGQTGQTIENTDLEFEQFHERRIGIRRRISRMPVSKILAMVAIVDASTDRDSRLDMEDAPEIEQLLERIGV